MHKKKFRITEINRDNDTVRETEASTYNDLMVEATRVIAGLIGNGEEMFDIDINLSNSFEYEGTVKTETIQMVIEKS